MVNPLVALRFWLFARRAKRLDSFVIACNYNDRLYDQSDALAAFMEGIKTREEFLAWCGRIAESIGWEHRTFAVVRASDFRFCMSLNSTEKLSVIVERLIAQVATVEAFVPLRPNEPKPQCVFSIYVDSDGCLYPSILVTVPTPPHLLRAQVQADIKALYDRLFLSWSEETLRAYFAYLKEALKDMTPGEKILLGES